MSRTPKRSLGPGVSQLGLKTPVMRHSGILPPPSARGNGPGRLTIAEMSGSRRTSVLLQPTTAAKALPREIINSYEYKAQMINKIYNFILKHEDDSLICTPENIANPTASMFRELFEAIYNHLSNDYEAPQQSADFNQQFIRIMDGLGFPVPIKPSAMQPMGAAHSYPLLLAALGWLVDVVTVHKAIASKTHTLMMNDDGSQGVVRYSFLHQAYKEYKQDRSIINQSGYMQTCEAKIKAIYEDTESLEEQEQALMATLSRVEEQLDTKKGHIQQLQMESVKAETEIETMQEDIVQVGNCLLDAKKAWGAAKKNYESVQAEMQRAKATLTETKAELDKISLAIKEQSERPDGVKRGEAKLLKAEQQRLRMECQTLNAEVERTSKEQWTNAKKFEKILTQQRDRLMDLHNRMMTLRGNLGEDTTQIIDLPRDNAELTSSARILGTTIRDLEAKLNCDIRMTESSIADLHKALANLDLNVEMAKEKLSCAKKEYERSLRKLQREKEELKKEREAKQTDIDNLENELESKQSKAGDLVAIEQEVQEHRRELECLKQQMDYDISDAKTKLEEKLAVLFEFHEAFQAGIAPVDAFIRQTVIEFETKSAAISPPPSAATAIDIENRILKDKN